MKNKFLFSALFALCALAFVGISSAFDKPETAPTTEHAVYAEEFAGPSGVSVSFDYRKDTLTNAEANTLNIGARDNSIWNTVTTPVTFGSLYTYNIQCIPLNLSGTISVKMVLDASNKSTPGTSTDWCAIDSITGTTAGRVLQLSGTEAKASRYRLRVIGAGTQSSTYEISTRWKKKN